LASGLERGGEITGIAPWEGFETEIEHAVEFVEGDAHIEADFGRGEPGTSGGFHDGDAVDIEPADSRRIDGLD